ncbi:MAG TPA: GGDEF domain-containing protein [Rugosibacter sp.]|nr:GGDEF domain-containing protein [Rugosibacter sp.]HQN45602.1 GGDEF domain-containing protein [Rugosibacter sp.]
MVTASVARCLFARRRSAESGQKPYPLPRLTSRQAFFGHCERALKRARRSRAHLAVLLLNLDMFKDINDTLGHAAGDQVLATVAGRLRYHFGPSMTVACMGGDKRHQSPQIVRRNSGHPL